MLSKFSQSEIVQGALWLTAFLAVCVLVGLGKLKPETVELMLMALFGASTPFGKGKSPDA